MADKTSAIRIWPMRHAPEAIVKAAPAGYEDGVCAVYGGTVPDEAGVAKPPAEWAASLSTSLGITDAAQATVVLVNVKAFLWTAYWRPIV